MLDCEFKSLQLVLVKNLWILRNPNSTKHSPYGNSTSFLLCWGREAFWAESLNLSKVWFYGISTIVGYLMPNPLYTYLLNIYMIWFGLFYGISTIVGYLMPNPLYTYLLNIYDLVWFVLWHINHCRLFNAKSSLYIYIKYIWFGLVCFMAYQPL